IGVIGVFAALALLISISAIIDINSLKQLSSLSEFSFEDTIRTKQQSYGSMFITISIWIFSIGLTILGSLTFHNLSSKKQRISAFMIPASQAEKFILSVLIYLVGGTLILIIGIFIGLGISQIAYGGGTVVYDGFFSFFDFDYSGTLIAAFILMVLLGNSIYALGSSIWPRLSWIKTWVVLTVIQWIGTIIMIVLSSADISWRSFFMFWDGHISLLQWTGLTLLSLLNIACWVFAWLRYSNTQIVQRFMTK
ncbi:MAG: hypothetical protein K2G77_00190, partial [Muribaculaceae bacterium]|nr:hypothetical protein [Muribaculaceae bacterium]